MENNMFPIELDNAKVLYYTPQDNYGHIYYENGDIAEHIKYLAICQYLIQNEEYYLFSCDENYEVVGDSVWSSINECMKMANTLYNGNIIWIEGNYTEVT